MRIVHLSDLHVGKSDEEWPATVALCAHARRLAPDAVVVSGDLIDPPDDDGLLRDVHGALESIGVPYVVVPGNHDVRLPGANMVFERYFGEFPRIERIGGATFLLFDSFGGLPVGERNDDDVDCFRNTGCWGDGRIPRSQFEAMERNLRDDDDVRLAVVHHHLEPSPDEKVNPLQNAAELGAWCAKHRVTHVFVGHWHETAAPAEVHGVTRLRIGRSTKAPYPFGVLDLDDRSYRIGTL